MNVDACLIVYGFVAALAAPLTLGGFNAVHRAPRLGVAAWVAAALSVPVAWLIAALSLATHPGWVAPAIGFALAEHAPDVNTGDADRVADLILFERNPKRRPVRHSAPLQSKQQLREERDCGAWYSVSMPRPRAC